MEHIKLDTNNHLRRWKRDDCAARSRFGLPRSSTESLAKMKSSSETTHRNGFFGRGSKDDEAYSAHESQMERGMAATPESSARSSEIDPRSGIVSPRATRAEAQTIDGAEQLY